MKKKIKILVGGIYHESHSFSNEPTDLEAFRKVLLLEGADSIEKLRDTTSEMFGFMMGAEKFGFEMIPTLWAWGVSTAPVQAETLDYLIDVVRRNFEEAEKVDGILFALHGAMVAENAIDGDGYILSKFREFAGNETPIVITLDLHANISELMVKKADAIVGYDTYPHIDQVERGLEAAELLVKTINGEIKPVMALEKPPMVIVPNVQFTNAYPMNEIISLAHKTESENGVLSVSVAGGFAYSDVPEIGPGILVVTDNNSELAEKCAKEISNRFWELREDFIPKLPGVSEAVKRAIESTSHPVILADVGDNIGAGTPGDSTFILSELVKQNAESAVVIIADEESVKTAVNVGVGQIVTLSIGGKTDEFHGEPVPVTGRVKLVSDGVFRNRGQMRDGIIENMGRTTVIESGGIKIVLTEIKMPPWNLEQLRSVGIEPENEKIIALKSAVAFRAAYEPIAGEIIEVNSPGLSSVDLSQFDYKHIRRPLYPFENREQRVLQKTFQ
jgi:microcystin degradation protein MlrC